MKPTRTYLLGAGLALIVLLGSFARTCWAQAAPAAPVITSLNPTSVLAGGPSFTLIVTGQNFGTNSTVIWTNIQTSTATSLATTYSQSTGQLSATVLGSFIVSPGFAAIQIINTYPPSYGYPTPSRYSSTVTFTIVAPPVITSINPSSTTAGCTGVLVTILGSGFVGVDGGSVVEWDSLSTGTQYLRPTFINSGELRLAVPDSYVKTADTAAIRVINPGLVASNSVVFTINPPPAIQSLTPNSAVVGGAQFIFTVTGSGFVQGSTVQWSTLSGSVTDLATTFVTSTQLRATVPASLIGTAGTARITVINPPCGVLSNVVNFEIVAKLTITTTSLPNGTVGVAYSAQLAAAGGTQPYSWSATGLPAWLTLNASTGVLAGTPTATGAFTFTVRVTDRSENQATASFTITVSAALTITSASPLPGGTVGTAYSQTLAATGGLQPYSWSATGLPTWLALNASTGVLSGTPAAAGAYNFTVQVTDGAKSTTSKAFSITIIQALTILTTSPLPGGTVASSYSQKLLAFGGVQPYIWAVSAGSVPPGLRLLGDAGDIMGTPTTAGTYSFTAQVTDTAKSAVTRAFTISVAPFGLPNVTLSGLTDTTPPTQQPRVQLGLASAAPAAITGRITLTFTPDAVVSGDNPAVQFSTGGRTVDFTIPAGGNRATFGNAADVGFQAGTVAGTITLTVRLQAGGVDVTPSPAPTVTTRVARAAPVITSAQVVRSGAGFEVRIIGYSTPRQVTSATFRFSVTGADLQTSEVTVSVDSAFSGWFGSAAAGPFGSEFRYVQPFTMSGDATAVTALTVTVTLSNATGTSASASGSF